MIQIVIVTKFLFFFFMRMIFNFNIISLSKNKYINFHIIVTLPHIVTRHAKMKMMNLQVFYRIHIFFYNV
jgi:hypothetical protein